MSQSTPTIKAAITYAAQIRAQGERERARDPYASPYMPTEASVRKLCHRMAQQATQDLPVDATPEDVAVAKASGPARAIAYMSMRAKQHASDVREQNEISERAAQRLKRRHEQHRKARDVQRAALRPGQRIDQAIARLRLVAAPSAAQVARGTPSSERVSDAPEFCVDAASRAVAIANRAAREIEALEDELKVRDLRAVA